MKRSKSNRQIIIIVVCVCIIVVAWLLWSNFGHMFMSTAEGMTTSNVVEKDGYVIKEYDNVLTKAECEELMKYSEQRGMEQSSVLNYGGKADTAVDMDSRKSTTLWIPDSGHTIATKLAKLTEELTGISLENQEMLQVVKYEPGGKFNPHFDACNIDDPEYKNRINHGSGQRIATFLVYLNDEFDGGETDFVDVGHKCIPKQGKAVLFWDTDEREEIIPLSRHMGCEVRGGNKWICTKWVHHKKWNH